jgi:predicted nucleotidyltransferase
MLSAMLDLDRDLPRKGIADLCRRFHVRELSIFGSALRDDFRGDSDVDLLVEFEPDAVVGMELIDLQLALEDLIGRRVDLAPKRGLRPLIRDEVLTSARVLYAA